MAEYIERDEILQKISRMIEYCKKDNKVNGLTALFQVGDAVIDCKSADVVPAVHAAWIFSDEGCYPYCSNCIEKSKDGKTTSFCPNCGAKMIKSYLRSSITVINTCICCGEIIPEGRQVCPKCENKKNINNKTKGATRL